MKRILLSIFHQYQRYRAFTKNNKFYKAARYALLMFIAACGFVFNYPQILFAHSVSYKNFKVYARQPIDENINYVLDSAVARLEKSQLYDKETMQNIFISDSFTFYKFLSLGRPDSFGITNPIVGNIRINKVDIADDLVFRDSTEFSQRSLSNVIAHEVTHNLVRNKFGAVKSFVSIPKWKNEGYSEYVAGETMLTFEEGVRRWRESPNDSSGYNYFMYQQMVKYLLDDQKISVQELFSQSFDEKEVETKTFAKICQN